MKKRILNVNLIELPGVNERLCYMVNRFHTHIKQVSKSVQQSAEVSEVIDKYNDIVKLQDLSEAYICLDKYKQAYTKAASDIIQSLGAMQSIIFSSAASALHRVIEGFLGLGEVEFQQFHERVLNSQNVTSKEINIVFYCTPPATSPHDISSPPAPQKRPKVTKRSWREKRPTPIITNLPVPMVKTCTRRVSKRIAKMNPRRSSRLMKLNQQQ
jgi:hypothetical protein